MQKKVIEFIMKNTWYKILLFSSSIYVLFYRKELYQLTELNIRNLILILWLILLIIPLFSEIEMFGIKLKKEIAKNKEEISELKNQIIKISNSNSNITNNYLNSTLPSKEEVQETTKKLTNHINKIPSEDKKVITDKIEEMKNEVGEQAIYLFQCRKILENLIRSIDSSKTRPFYPALLEYTSKGLIKKSTRDLIMTVYKITVKSAHSIEPLEDTYVDLVYKALPEITSELTIAKKQYDELCKVVQNMSKEEVYTKLLKYANEIKEVDRLI